MNTKFPHRFLIYLSYHPSLLNSDVGNNERAERLRKGKTKSARFIIQHGSSRLSGHSAGSRKNNANPPSSFRVYQHGNTFSLKHSLRIVATDTDETVLEEGSDMESCNGTLSVVEAGGGGGGPGPGPASVGACVGASANTGDGDGVGVSVGYLSSRPSVGCDLEVIDESSVTYC